MSNEKQTIGQVIDEAMTREEFVHSVTAGINAIGAFDECAEEVRDLSPVVRGVSELGWFLSLAELC